MFTFIIVTAAFLFFLGLCEMLVIIGLKIHSFDEERIIKKYRIPLKYKVWQRIMRIESIRSVHFASDRIRFIFAILFGGRAHVWYIIGIIKRIEIQLHSAVMLYLNSFTSTIKLEPK